MKGYENVPEDLMSKKNLAMLESKKSEIQALAESSDGRKVKEILDKNGSIEKALADGDMNAVKSAITGILNTDSGARLAKQLSELLK